MAAAASSGRSTRHDVWRRAVRADMLARMRPTLLLALILAAPLGAAEAAAGRRSP
jgi:hypothetical protein